MAASAYSGGCHCGAVRYEVSADLGQSISCNCSRCSKLGAVLSFAPAEKFSLLSGEDRLTEYRFNKRVIQHLFFSACGIESFARGSMPDGTAMAAINATRLDGVDAASLNPHRIDGRSR